MKGHSLNLDELDANPFIQFEKWFKKALDLNVVEPGAMALATATKEGIPSCRFVLLKQWTTEGAIFFTDLRSRKSKELLSNPHACASFFWKELEQQIHIEGPVKQVSRAIASTYFQKRPRGSQIAASISHQGQDIDSEDYLMEEFLSFEKSHQYKEIPTPKHWGGFLIKPIHFEFWQGKKDRLHDRFSYKKQGKSWIISRLSP